MYLPYSHPVQSTCKFVNIHANENIDRLCVIISMSYRIVYTIKDDNVVRRIEFTVAINLKALWCPVLPKYKQQNINKYSTSKP